MRLHVNIDHVATLRQARGTSYPDPVWAASICELAGAHGITCHLREDRRHMVDRDIRVLRQTVRTVLNLEMAATEEMLGIALEVKPEIVTLVPERREERTTEGGLHLGAEGAARRLEPYCRKLADAGIEVSLFVDADVAHVKRARELGVPRSELSTGEYAEAKGAEALRQCERLSVAAEEGVAAGLHVAAGHGLDYPNVSAIAGIPGIEELNIGHAIVARAVFVGLDRAVRDMIDLMRRAAS
jgi:pyridoxine 5-phosphate synthase